MNYISIATFPNRLMAETFGNALAEKGIPFIVKSDDLGIAGGAGASLGATLWVPDDLAARARLVLPCIFPDEGEDGETPVFEPVSS